MKLKYETAIATLVQFVVLTLLNVGTGTVSVVSTCRTNGNDCGSNLISSLIFFMVLALWFGCVWVLGYAAQEKRSKRLARLLIVAEILIAVVALFNAKHHPDFLSLCTSLIDFALSIWIITLAYRLMRAGSGRIVSRQHRRDKPGGRPTDHLVV